MWFFSSPQIVFGEGALSHLSTLPMNRVFVVSDRNLERAGVLDRVLNEIKPRAIPYSVFTDVEPDPTLHTALVGGQAMAEFNPDWIIAVGGGSVMDAAKAMWILYERPDLSPEAINPIETLGLRSKARLVAIPTTIGTGSEATWAVVLTDPVEKRKLGLGSREALPDIALLDPQLVEKLPHRIAMDTALDALTHAIEGFTSTWHNDFSDGLCLRAAQMVFEYLPVLNETPENFVARERLQNAATIAGLGFGNSMAALAHGLGHALGAVFHTPHGRSVSLFLPYTIEYAARGEEETRYRPLAHALRLPDGSEREAAESLAKAIRALELSIGQPLSVREAGISMVEYRAAIDLLASNALNDTQTIMSTRVPEMDDLRRLFDYAYDGRPVDF